jgi:hypothetical protein
VKASFKVYQNPANFIYKKAAYTKYLVRKTAIAAYSVQPSAHMRLFCVNFTDKTSPMLTGIAKKLSLQPLQGELKSCSLFRA